MSITEYRYASLICDVCEDEISTEFPDALAAVVWALDDGWQRVSGAWLCPDCVDDGESHKVPATEMVSKLAGATS